MDLILENNDLNFSYDVSRYYLKTCHDGRPRLFISIKDFYGYLAFSIASGGSLRKCLLLMPFDALIVCWSQFMKSKTLLFLLLLVKKNIKIVRI